MLLLLSDVQPDTVLLAHVTEGKAKKQCFNLKNKFKGTKGGGDDNISLFILGQELPK
jgi:hypothetical protein